MQALLQNENQEIMVGLYVIEQDSFFSQFTRRRVILIIPKTTINSSWLLFITVRNKILYCPIPSGEHFVRSGCCSCLFISCCSFSNFLYTDMVIKMVGNDLKLHILLFLSLKNKHFLPQILSGELLHSVYLCVIWTCGHLHRQTCS